MDSGKQRANSEMNHLEFLQGRSELISLPRRIVFELTNRCGLRCVPCARETADVPVSDLPMEVVRRFEGVMAFAEEVSLRGWGEGTLHPRFAEILGLLNSIPGLRKTFVTTGSTLNRIHWALFEHRVDVVTLLLEGVCPAAGGVQPERDREGKIAALRKLLAEKERRGKDYPAVTFAFTVRRGNLHRLSGLVALAAELRVPEVDVEYLTVFSPELLSESLLDRQEEVRRAFSEARRRAAALGVRLNLPEIQGEGEAGELPHRLCPLAWQDLYVGSDGRLRPCKASLQDLGPAGEWENFYDLWNSPALRQFRRRVNDVADMPEGCSRCFHSRYANVNRPHAFLQASLLLAPPSLSRAADRDLLPPWSGR